MIRLLIAEDVRMVRGALVALLELEPDVKVVAEVGSGDAVVPAALEVRPDLAILDINLPGQDGLTAAAKLRSYVPDCRVLLLTSLSHPTVLRRALALPGTGLLLKDAPPSELFAAVRRTMTGERVVDPQLALSFSTPVDGLLTPREVEVLRLAAEGDDVRQIARQLHLSVGTVRNYLTAVVQKLDARNRVDAVRIARESGMI
ncbi:response regulator transcription factor [Streptomyces sp. BE20]|uniref:response regulator transcription factor n=1 Tax=Streptomyces sp. BE20 TaxID=3002525 RepID=UPI002E75CEB1|nr:response regulator transcription factor [Streptomyces sp. BE20]MEE1828592.1 response regulator transcription factor [Streptomyces sp. BE20]